MSEHLFPRFLEDEGEYKRAEALWANRWHELLARLGQSGRWQSPWLNTAFADGTPFGDGNPIFSAVSPGQRRGIRVIQLDVSDAETELSSWRDTFGAGDSDAVEELVIACALTPQTLRAALALMERWVMADARDLREFV